MDIFDKLGDAFAVTGKEVANLAKEVTGSAKDNFKLKEEEFTKSKLFYQLGKEYYELNKNTDFDTLPESIAELFAAIEKCEARMARYKEEIANRKDVKTCPNCGEKYSINNPFCTKCGRDNTDLR